jgi:hypothetical protein
MRCWSEYSSRYSDSLDVPGIEYRWRRDFPYPSRLILWPTQLPVDKEPGLSRGETAGRGVCHPPLFIAEVKERVDLYILPFGPSWSVPVELYM